MKSIALAASPHSATWRRVRVGFTASRSTATTRSPSPSVRLPLLVPRVHAASALGQAGRQRAHRQCAPLHRQLAGIDGARNGSQRPAQRKKPPEDRPTQADVEQRKHQRVRPLAPVRHNRRREVQYQRGQRLEQLNYRDPHARHYSRACGTLQRRGRPRAQAGMRTIIQQRFMTSKQSRMPQQAAPNTHPGMPLTNTLSATGAWAATPPTLRRTWLVAFAALLYLLPGILGHAPWKQDETYSFGMIQSFLHGKDWIVPINAGQPFMEKPPLYYWVAALIAGALSQWLPLHDGARLTTMLCGAATLLVLAAWSRMRARDSGHTADAADAARRDPWQSTLVTLSLFGGTLIMAKHAHDLFTDVALVTGTVCALYGLYRIAWRVQGGHGATLADVAWFGIGTGIAQMTKGLFIPGVLALTAAALPVAPLRIGGGSRGRTEHAIFSRMACIARASLASALRRVLGSDNDHWVVLRGLLIGTIPSGPLALYALARGGWRRITEPATGIALIFCVLGIGLLSLSATARVLYLLPFVAPLAVLGADGAVKLPAALQRGWSFLSIALFGAFGALAWFIWAVMTQPIAAHGAARWLQKWLPLDYVIPFQPAAVGFAIALCVAWFIACRHARRLESAQAPLAWFAGVTLAWGLVFTLLLPWLDRAKSYTPVFERLAASIHDDWRCSDCMTSIGLGESEAPMLEYATGIVHQPVLRGSAPPTACRWLIVQDNTAVPDRGYDGWKRVWQGARQARQDRSRTGKLPVELAALPSIQRALRLLDDTDHTDVSQVLGTARDRGVIKM
ncbi:hypothetical protein DFQ30_008396 [Apophysomyces sp. BC1015]|nr:hypothetical protein DFQ30_008396 [Apophysomyces sp. BC1015]